MMPKITLLAAWLAPTTFAIAQFASAGITSTNTAGEIRPRQHSSLAAWTYTIETEAGFDEKSDTFPYEQVRARETTLKLGWPLYLGTEWRLFNGLDWQWHQFSFQGSPKTSGRTHTINTHVISMPFRCLIPAGKQWQGMLVLSPGLYSDLDYVDWHDLRLAGMGMATHQFSPAFTWSVGLAYGRIFDREMFFPVAGLTWRPAAQWQLLLAFPRPALIYSPMPRLHFSAILMPAGNEWNITDDFTGQRVEYDLRFKGYRAGAQVDYDLTRRLAVHGAAGVVFLRRYELLDNGDTIAEADVGETWFMQIGLRLR